MTRAPWRDHIVTALIAFVSTFFGVALIQGAQFMLDLNADEGGTFKFTLYAIALTFIGIGAYTAAVVTSNTFTTIVAGRVREIAQLRLIGAKASSLRAKLATEGLIAALIGSVTGLVVGLIAYFLAVQWAMHVEPALDVFDYTWFAPASLVPAVFAVLTVWFAAYIGSRAVGKVSPVQALSTSVEAPVDLRRAGIGRIVGFWLLFIPGVLLLALGCVLGAVSPGGVLIAFWGGVFSFTAIVVGAVLIVPRLMRLVGKLFGTGAPAVIATENAVRSPRAATRGVIGMVIGVALIVMFVVATATMRDVVWAYVQREGATEEELALFDQGIAATTAIMITLTAVSAVLAAIGMVSNLALAVIQRRRELGMLRAIGMTVKQVRAMVLIEAAVTALVAVVLGALLGIFYGWAGAQSTFGSLTSGGWLAPSIQWHLPIIVILGAIALALAAGIGPALRATRQQPIEALAVS